MGMKQVLKKYFLKKKKGQQEDKVNIMFDVSLLFQWLLWAVGKRILFMCFISYISQATQKKKKDKVAQLFHFLLLPF